MDELEDRQPRLGAPAAAAMLAAVLLLTMTLPNIRRSRDEAFRE